MCVTCRSCVIRPAIHPEARYDFLAVWKCALWMGNSLCDTIPMTKLSQPMISCADAYSQRIRGRSRLLAHSRHVVVPLPRKYSRSSVFTSEFVSTVSIHFSTADVDSLNAASRPTSGHQAMCLHVSVHARQLGHRGLQPSWCDRYFMVLAILRTCFDAHS